MSVATAPVIEAFDPLAPEFLADPYAHMDGLPPVFFAPSIGVGVVVRVKVVSDAQRAAQ